MKVNLIEEEILYEELDDYQGSTYPERNLINKQQSTPSQGNPETCTLGSKNNDSEENDLPEVNSKAKNDIEQFNLSPSLEKPKKKIKRETLEQQNMNTQLDDSIAIMKEVINEGTNLFGDQDTRNKNMDNKIIKSKTKKDLIGKSKNKDLIENEIPLLTKRERDEIESIQDIYDQNDAPSGTFVMTPTKK